MFMFDFNDVFGFWCGCYIFGFCFWCRGSKLLGNWGECIWWCDFWYGVGIVVYFFNVCFGLLCVLWMNFLG